MIFVAAGVRRSASTLCFQIASELVGLEHRIRKWPRDKPRNKNPFDTKTWWVTKSHNYLPDAKTRPGRMIAFITIRDPRDIAVSMMQLHGESFEKNMRRGLIKRDLNQANLWLKNVPEFCHVHRYEDIIGDMELFCHLVSSAMGKACMLDKSRELAERYSIEKNRERSDIARGTRHDFVFPGHTQDGKIGKWKETLTNEQARVVETIVGKEWMERWGYL